MLVAMLSRRNTMTLGEPIAPDQSKIFAGESPGKARTAASVWLGDFSQHGPLHIHRIRVARKQDTFLAVVTYSEMAPLI